MCITKPILQIRRLDDSPEISQSSWDPNRAASLLPDHVEGPSPIGESKGATSPGWAGMAYMSSSVGSWLKLKGLAAAVPSPPMSPRASPFARDMPPTKQQSGCAEQRRAKLGTRLQGP